MVDARSVLVVDDSEPIRSLLAQALRAHGFAVRLAEDGFQALRIAHSASLALAIVDQWMPGMTGAEVIRILRGSPRADLRMLPIIGLSGRPGSEKDLIGAGAGAFLAKPFGESELIATVRLALGEVSARSGSGS